MRAWSHQPFTSPPCARRVAWARPAGNLARAAAAVLPPSHTRPLGSRLSTLKGGAAEKEEAWEVCPPSSAVLAAWPVQGAGCSRGTHESQSVRWRFRERANGYRRHSRKTPLRPTTLELEAGAAGLNGDHSTVGRSKTIAELQSCRLSSRNTRPGTAVPDS